MSASGNIEPLRLRFPLWMPVLVALFGLANFVAMPLASAIGPRDPGDVLLMAVVLGLTTAQAGVVAVWFVWSEWPLWLRLALHWLAGLFLFGCWGLGLIHAELDASPMRFKDIVDMLVVTACLLPPICLAVQLPLWACRLLLSWRVLPQEAATGPNARPSILDLMVGTVVVAIWLGCLRAAALVPWANNATYWLECGVAGLMITGVSAVVLLPLVAIVLRPRAFETATYGMLVFFVAVLAVAEAIILMPIATMGARGSQVGEVIIVSGAYFVVTLASLTAPLAIVRGQGYRLRFRRDAQRGLAGRAEPS